MHGLYIILIKKNTYHNISNFYVKFLRATTNLNSIRLSIFFSLTEICTYVVV